MKVLKVRQKFDKYRIERKLGDGGFGAVYQAFDTIEGVRVALKIPHADWMDQETLEVFRREARLVARLDHPNILPLKNASFIQGRFVIVYALGQRTLEDRLRSRISMRTALDFAEQILEAVACAHRHKIIHCDIKPGNLILFTNNRIRLTDFGIARVAHRTVRASGSGTVGYIAPEQAMGQPSFRSDVFSVGLILYRMFSGQLPEWPFEWPPPGFPKMRRLHPELINLIRRSMELNPKKRFQNGEQMLAAFRKLKRRALRHGALRGGARSGDTAARDWQTIRWRQFQRKYRRALDTRQTCRHCHGPIAEPMKACPWCGKPHRVSADSTSFPAQCRRCKRGMKLDWKYCPWCYGPAYQPLGNRQYTDRRYSARCANPKCKRKQLMPFMRYCPWCHQKVRRKWDVPDSDAKCASCGWGVLRSYWTYCPWCGKILAKK